MRARRFFCLVLVVLCRHSSAQASYHLNEIQQVIGGVEGNTAAQAIQLRMREPAQELITHSRIRAFDAQGKNPVLIIEFDADVLNARVADTILVTSPAFNRLTDPPTVPDFTMTNTIPSSYLPAGSLTFEGPDGIILWRTCWGGTSYTGSATGSLVNDGDGNFGPAFADSLPGSGFSSILITRAATSLSNNSAVDYSLTAGPAVFVNNARTQFTLLDRCPNDPTKAEPGSCGCGAADTDRDADGRADCVDPCPDNPADAAANACATPNVNDGSTLTPPAFSGCGMGSFQAAAISGILLFCRVRPRRLYPS